MAPAFDWKRSLHPVTFSDVNPATFTLRKKKPVPFDQGTKG